MLTLEIVVTLNSHLQCPSCHTAGTWVEASRPKRRQNSTLHQLRCRQCGNRVAAKVSGGTQDREDHCVQLKNEYATLCNLRDAFSQDDGSGILEPLGYLELAGHGILVTQWFAGTDLARSARRLKADELEQAFRQAGAWLLRLHGADNDERSCRSLDVAQKIANLTLTYGDVLRTSSRTRGACELLAAAGRDLEALATRPVRIHGDFKPQNMLYNDSRCVGLDIHWRIVGAPVYDLAPFLNHLWLAGVGNRSLSAGRRYQLAEEAFLHGYGTPVSMQALRWAQLYFALCHVGGYRQRGPLGAVYANWKIWPLVERLERQLRETV
jgi:hypothetical protein